MSTHDLRAAGRHLLDTRPAAVSPPDALRCVLQRTEGTTVGASRASATEWCDRLDRARDGSGEGRATRLRDGTAHPGANQ